MSVTQEATSAENLQQCPPTTAQDLFTTPSAYSATPADAVGRDAHSRACIASTMLEIIGSEILGRPAPNAAVGFGAAFGNPSPCVSRKMVETERINGRRAAQ